jgi:hypothetical protein
MSCRGVRRRLSAYRDGDLPRAESREVAAHLGACPACAGVWKSLGEALSLLAGAPRLDPGERIAARVLDRLELESRGPGLALLFRSALAARPLILPSLVPAALVLVTVLAAALALDRESRPHERIAMGAGAPWDRRLPASGTEGNPLLLSAGVSLPRVRSGIGLTPAAVADLGESNLFVETVVARDGSVSLVRLLDGDSQRAEPLLDLLRRERFEPGRYRGRPVAVSLYRLISSLEVRPPST